MMFAMYYFKRKKQIRKQNATYHKGNFFKTYVIFVATGSIMNGFKMFPFYCSYVFSNFSTVM